MLLGIESRSSLPIIYVDMNQVLLHCGRMKTHAWIWRLHLSLYRLSDQVFSTNLLK
jgi:hypothetical protein